MMIRVLYADKSRGFVEDCNIDDLAGKGLIVAYSLPESDEWVDVKNKHIKQENHSYCSQENIPGAKTNVFSNSGICNANRRKTFPRM